MKNNLSLYQDVYLYQLITLLNQDYDPDIFDSVSFQIGEANSDFWLKQAIINFIKKDKSRRSIQKIRYVQDSSGKCFEIDPEQFYVQDVLIPSRKEVLKNNQVGVVPDLVFLVKFFDSVYRWIVEIKSTKGNKIPGSSVQQINAQQHLIFVKWRKNHCLSQNKLTFTAGYYQNCLCPEIIFPNRSPRAQVSYQLLANHFNNNYDYDGNQHLVMKTTLNSQNQFLESWQTTLLKRWLDLAHSSHINLQDAHLWFNQLLLKFLVCFLETNFIGKDLSEQQEIIYDLKEKIKQFE